ncbi:hypothetical protein E1B28_008037 [Marasmius oreades]|uniref:AA9 family lytic polysaccharide monooxygenase n=1 Tax=Marasmius oreades TaxID=181124 RepID=A0A9P7S370_9AGAR|nr:uncharacterized protein E1B28_008037 [Marasmius oreades]KAG7094440.1 hypothetical protein E1B28_008037 [Marasmius oreades]
MKSPLFYLLAAALKSHIVIPTVLAHSRVYGVWVNEVFQGDGRDIYIRSPPTNEPVKDIYSNDMTCNVHNRAVPKTVNVATGDKLTFEWYHESRKDDIINDSHKGAIQVYIAPSASNGTGAVWTKLFSDSFDGSLNNKWATDRLKKAKGQHYIIIPNIPTGDYLFRAEITALHQAQVRYDQDHDKGAEFYIECVQVRVQNDRETLGSVALPGGTSLPGTYSYDSHGIIWNLFGSKEEWDPRSYVPPGPAVWEGAKGGKIEMV